MNQSGINKQNLSKEEIRRTECYYNQKQTNMQLYLENNEDSTHARCQRNKI